MGTRMRCHPFLAAEHSMTTVHETRFGLHLDELRKMSRSAREEFARKAGKMVFYLPAEGQECRKSAEAAVLRARPTGHDPMLLNGINIGAGTRRIDPLLTPVDVKRLHREGPQIGAILSSMMPLPFRDETIDYIISLHALEHVPNPVEIVSHWLDIVKPGGGIGLVLPDWRYCWDARKDFHMWGHKWNTEPDVLKEMHTRHWKDRCELEQLDSYDWKFSFDVVLRKHGTFEPFDPSAYLTEWTGAKMAAQGCFVSDSYQSR